MDGAATQGQRDHERFIAERGDRLSYSPDLDPEWVRLTALCRRGEGDFDSKLFTGMHETVSLSTALKLEAFLAITSQHDSMKADWLRDQNPDRPRGMTYEDVVPREIKPEDIERDIAGVEAMLAADQAAIDGDETGTMAGVLAPVIQASKVKLAELRAKLEGLRGD